MDKCLRSFRRAIERLKMLFVVDDELSLSTFEITYIFDSPARNM